VRRVEWGRPSRPRRGEDTHLRESYGTTAGLYSDGRANPERLPENVVQAGTQARPDATDLFRTGFAYTNYTKTTV